MSHFMHRSGLNLVKSSSSSKLLIKNLFTRHALTTSTRTRTPFTASSSRLFSSTGSDDKDNNNATNNNTQAFDEKADRLQYYDEESYTSHDEFNVYHRTSQYIQNDLEVLYAHKTLLKERLNQEVVASEKEFYDEKKEAQFEELVRSGQIDENDDYLPVSDDRFTSLSGDAFTEYYGFDKLTLASMHPAMRSKIARDSDALAEYTQREAEITDAFINERDTLAFSRLMDIEEQNELKRSADEVSEEDSLAEPTIDEFGCAKGKGGRKNSTAHVWIKPGTGHVFVNEKCMADYFDAYSCRGSIVEPFLATDTAGQFDVFAVVNGGGVTGQAEAIRHAAANALQFYDPSYRKTLKKMGLLTRDRRVVERKHYGRKKARKGFTWVKR